MCSPTAERAAVQEEWRIEVRNGKLAIQSKNLGFIWYSLPVYSGLYTIDIGCHSLTPEAWELLKEKVDGKA